MKKYNIEEQLAHKLGQQSISPSADAWERITHNRKAAAPVKKKRAWYFIAAALLVFIAGGYMVMVFIVDTATVKEPQMVNSGEGHKQSITPIGLTVEEPVAVGFPKTEKQLKVAHATSPVVVVKREEAVVLNVSGNPIIVNEPAQKETVIKAYNPVAVTHIYAMEADMLLKEAVKNSAIKKQSAAPTNDTALLKEVETEMNDYYRDKAMRFFVLKHKTIRFAVRDKE